MEIGSKSRGLGRQEEKIVKMVMTITTGANGANGMKDLLPDTPFVKNADLRLASKAALPAYTGANLYLSGAVPTLAIAAAATGSCVPSVRAMVTLIQSGDHKLIRHVLLRHIPLLEAAKRIEPVVKLVAAYRAAKSDPKNLAMFGNIVGSADLWDNVIMPTL